MPRPNTPGVDLSWGWIHTAGVRRLTGVGVGGPVFTPAPPASPDTVTGMWTEVQDLVRDPDGNDVVSAAQFGHAITDARIPVGSQMVSPAEFGSRTYTVISSSGFDTGPLHLPKFWFVTLR